MSAYWKQLGFSKLFSWKKKNPTYLGQHFNVLKMVKLKQMFEFSLHFSQSKSEVEKSKG